MTYVKVLCPHCGHRIMKINPSDWVYGSPIRTCRHCKKNYIDPRYHEIAIDGISKDSMSVKMRIPVLIIGLYLLYRGYYLLTHFTYDNRVNDYLLPIVILIFGICFTVGVCIDLVFILTGAKAKRMEKLRQESVRRLQNYTYAHKLKDLGYSVPEEYL